MGLRFLFRFGVYEIINKVNGHCYIGGAGGRSINQRLNDHLRTLRSNTHHNIYLQRAYNLYGVSWQHVN